MKANKFFLGLALIGAILTGCDSKVEPTPEDGAGKAYVSVRISMASTAGTRATTDGGFAVGTEAEQKINGANSIFLFYDKDGKWVTSGQLQTQDPGADNKVPGGDHEAQVNDRSTDAYIVLSGPDVELKKSTQILTVVNYSNCESLKQLDLVEALEEITTTTSDPANAGFLMSTSVYVDGGKIVNTTAITGENIQPDAATAKTKAVDIYIERASAKAELNINTTDPNFGKLTVANDKGIIVDGVLSDVTVAINKWNLNNVYETTYLVKHIDDAWKTTAPFTGWNWAENHRSYWAKGQNWEGTGAGAKTVRTYEEANVAVAGYTYCYENTVKTPAYTKGTETPNINTVLIAAQFKVASEDYQNLYKYNGIFYREATYKALLVKQLNDAKYQKDDAALTTSDIAIGTDGSLAGVKITLADGNYTLAGSSSSKTAAETYVNGTSYVTATKGYANGKCFYQIPVEHLGGLVGMVRNHWYQIKINSINHVGEPVYNEEVEIPNIPEETTEYYLAAEIHVLSWHVVEQSVDL